ncbi:MAG: hypothetical protein BJ554DRAFT_6913, partial [Olpidium bornovanus]
MAAVSLPPAGELAFASQILAQLAARPVRFGSDYCPHYPSRRHAAEAHVFRPACASSSSSTTATATAAAPAGASSSAAASVSDRVTLIAKLLKGTGPSHEVVLERGATIAALKAALEPLTGLAAKDQRLVVKGKALQDGHTLADYCVVDGSIVNVLAKTGSVQTVPVSLPPAPAPWQPPAEEMGAPPGGPEGDPLDSVKFWTDLRSFLRRQPFPGGDAQADAVLREFM